MPVTVKLSDELVNSARRTGMVVHRSVPAQIEYWAELGKIAELDLYPKIRQRAFKAGQLNFDDLSEKEQSEVAISAITTPTKTTFNPTATGKAVCEWDEELNRMVQYRPDGSAWIGKIKNRKFIAEKKIR